MAESFPLSFEKDMPFCTAGKGDSTNTLFFMTNWKNGLSPVLFPAFFGKTGGFAE